jgi:serine protease
MKKRSTFILLFVLSVFALQAQQPSGVVPGELLLRLQKGVNPEAFLAKINRLSGGGSGLFLKSTVVAEWDIYLFGYTPDYAGKEALLDLTRQQPEIDFALWNRYVEERSVTPDDPDWFQQADMSLINAPEAWETSTGGLTFNGDTIVVAALEKGALLTHPDLAPNRFWNYDEIPDDGIDNDGNGFIDDFGGWNPITEQDDTGNNGAHGTAIFGIMGAVGNNGLGVTGVNWRIKMLNLSGVDTDKDVVSATYYVFKMRQLYNNTNGDKGAFIVASNNSFGFNNQQPCSTPNLCEWCGLFDSLGTVGVISVGATTNSNVNVDVVGDMPTTCKSEFLVAVTNVNNLGTKIPSGYGKISIDLGAPGGVGTYTTLNVGNNNPGYGTNIGGTSAATPHVTGAIGLLYSLGCEGFTSDAISNPAVCARRVRDAILNNTQPNSSLDSITVTGGVLDIKRAVDGVTELCKGSVGPLDVLQVRTFIEGEEVRVFYQTPIFEPYQFRVCNMLGQLMHEEDIVPNQFSENYVRYNFSNLPAGVYVLSISRGNAIVSVKFPKI